MGKLISKNDAAEMLGVSRSTINNWCYRGVFEPKYINGTMYLDEDTIHALYDNVESVNNGRNELDRLEKYYEEQQKEWRRNFEEWEKDLNIIANTPEAKIIKQFLHSVIDMVSDTSKLSWSVKDVVHGLIEGDTLESISKSLNVPRENIRSNVTRYITEMNLFYSAAKELHHQNEIVNENYHLKAKIEALTQEIQKSSPIRLFTPFELSEDEKICYEVLSSNINDVCLGLSKTIVVSLKQSGYTAIADLIGLNEEQLSSIHGIGKIKAQKIKESLNEFLTSLTLENNIGSSMFVKLCNRIITNNEINKANENAKQQ